MKAVFFILLSFLPASIFCQISNHFDHQDSRWNVAKTKPAGTMDNPNFVSTRTSIYGLQGDSLIGDDQWFKIYAAEDELFENNLTYRGLLRSEGQQVFYLDTLNQLDTLYNFGLNEGDSAYFNFYDGTFAEWLAVTEVDSVELNGEFYKTITFSEPIFANAFDQLSEMWIEGIGSIHGPLFPNDPRKFSEEYPDSMLLTCSYSSQLLVWQNPFYSDCYINIVQGVENLESENFKVYPNPFAERIFIENKQFSSLEISLSNSLGQVVLRRALSANVESIDLAGLKTGFYFMTIAGENFRETVKLVKRD